MNDAEYSAFVDETRAKHGDEEAARLIEARCRPPLPSRLQRGPVTVSAREMIAARKGTGEVAEDATGQQGGAA